MEAAPPAAHCKTWRTKNCSQLPVHRKAKKRTRGTNGGVVTVEEIKKNKDNLSWFVRKFYKNNHEDSGRAVQFTNPDDDREYYDIAASISRSEWKWQEHNDVRRWHDAQYVREQETAFDVVYDKELYYIRSRFHERNEYLSTREVIEKVEIGEALIKPENSRLKVRRDADEIRSRLIGKGIEIEKFYTHDKTATIYIYPYDGLKIRIADHIDKSIVGLSNFNGIKRRSEEAWFQWRSDLDRGIFNGRIKHYSIEDFVEDYIAECPRAMLWRTHTDRNKSKASLVAT
jgi:hypothetical protein